MEYLNRPRTRPPPLPHLFLAADGLAERSGGAARVLDAARHLVNVLHEHLRQQQRRPSSAEAAGSVHEHREAL